jgi:hypothetical protein
MFILLSYRSARWPNEWEGTGWQQQHWGVVLSFPCLRMFLPVLLAGAVKL